MKNAICLIKALIPLSILLSPSLSYGAGFATDSHSASALGTSYAGSVSGANDISDSFFNPATLSNVKKNQLVLSSVYINFKVDDDNSSAVYNSNSSSVSGVRSDRQTTEAFVPAGYFASKINDKTTFGLSITSPFGLSTSYNPNWVGRYYAIDSEINSINFNPMLSYELNKKLSLGFGLQAQYIKATLTNAADVGGLFFSNPGSSDGFAKTKGDDWGFGFNLGAKYKLNDKLEFGIGYRSAIKHKIEGKVKLDSSSIGNLSSSFNSKLVTPENLTIGFKYDVNDKLLLLHDTSWTRWSRVKSLVINAGENSALSETVNFDLKDSFRYSFGAHYNVSNKTKLKLGTAYEEGAVDKMRNPRIPTGDKIWASIGIGYKINEATKIDATYLHEFYNKNKVNLSAQGLNTTNIEADYKNKIDVVAVSLRIEF